MKEYTKKTEKKLVNKQEIKNPADLESETRETVETKRYREQGSRHEIGPRSCYREMADEKWNRIDTCKMVIMGAEWW